MLGWSMGKQSAFSNLWKGATRASTSYSESSSCACATSLTVEFLSISY